jgi:pimeloyl-ACP methyl ester carboxylesterase
VITRTVTLDDGLTIGFRETGEPEVRPVVLLHALGSKSSTWDTVAAALAEAGRHVIAVDLRGHGRSGPAEEYSYRLMADDVLRFLEHRGIKRIDLVGHSLGGAVAMFVAIGAPELVERLVIEDVAPPMRNGRPEHDRPEPPAEAPEPVDFHWPVVPAIYRAMRAPDPDWWARLPTITARTLLVSGGPTSHVAPSRMAELATVIPDATLSTVDVGHHIHRDQPDEFAGLVLPFLR